MKRFWCIFTLCAILSGTVFTLLVAGLSLGDVNGNATLDSNDCALIRSAFLGNLTLGREEQSAVDINQNGRVDSNDYLLARMAVLGITGPESFYLSGILSEVPLLGILRILGDHYGLLACKIDKYLL